jgi:hypothetical protein
MFFHTLVENLILMKLLILVLCLLCFFNVRLLAFNPEVIGGRASAMGNSSAASSDFWSSCNNQAGLAFYDHSAAGVYFSNRFMLKENALQAGAFSLKTKAGILGASVLHTGDANFNSTKAGLLYARKFGNRVAAGLQLDYIHTALAAPYGSKRVVTFEAGLMVKLSEQLTLGAHTFNPVHAQLAEFDQERIPSEMKAGLAYSPGENISLTAEAYKNSEFPMEFRAGAEYRFGRIACVRVGLSNHPANYTFGFGLQLKHVTLDLSSSVHSVLGYSPQVSLQYQF